MSSLDFSIVANNNDSVYIQVVDQDEVAVNITGYSVVWQVFSQKGTPALITKTTENGGIAIINAAEGVFGLTLLPSDTLPLPEGYYIHEAVITSPSGNSVTITNDDEYVTYGTMYLRQQYTAQE